MTARGVEGIITLNRDDPTVTIPLTQARSWRTTALKGDVYRNRAGTGPGSANRTPLQSSDAPRRCPTLG